MFNTFSISFCVGFRFWQISESSRICEEINSEYFRYWQCKFENTTHCRAASTIDNVADLARVLNLYSSSTYIFWLLLFQSLVPKEDESLDSIDNAVEDEISSTAEVGPKLLTTNLLDCEHFKLAYAFFVVLRIMYNNLCCLF